MAFAVAILLLFGLLALYAALIVSLSIIFRVLFERKFSMTSLMILTTAVCVLCAAPFALRYVHTLLHSQRLSMVAH
jgi:hypothetical protein